MNRVVTLCAALLVCAALPAVAHHSTAQYNFGNQVYVQGKVKKIRFANPHLQLVLEVSDANGKHDLEFEGHSMNNFYRAGWRKDMVKEGDVVSVRVAPLKGAEEGGYVTGMKTADGRQF